MKILSQPPKLMGAGSKRAGGRQKKINKLSDFADQIPTPKTSKGAAGVEIRLTPHYYVRALAVAAVSQSIAACRSLVLATMRGFVGFCQVPTDTY
jgi:hypothetical protein